MGKKVIQICLALCGKVAALNMRDNKENESYRFFSFLTCFRLSGYFQANLSY